MPIATDRSFPLTFEALLLVGCTALQVEVSAKGRSTSRPGELVDGSLLPTLPLAHGQAGSSEYAPSLELVRLTEAVAHRVSALSV